MKHFKYASYVLRHKLYVGLECLKVGLLWRGLVHDLSKLLPSEWFPYVNHFRGDRRPKRTRAGYNIADDPNKDPAFDEAWLRHIHRNDHHWQFWLLKKDEGEFDALPMPQRARLEMVCDWRGAGAAQGQKGGWFQTQDWWRHNRDRIVLHPETRQWVEDFLLNMTRLP
jgi:hypothetical protein